MTAERKKRRNRFEPPPYLQNGHIQTITNSMKLRRLLIHRRAESMLQAAAPRILDCGGGVRLMGYYSAHHRNPPALNLTDPDSTDLCILIHGWEGDATSSSLLSARC